MKKSKIKGLTINQAEFKTPSGKINKVAVFLYGGPCDPKPILDFAVSQYIGTNDNYLVLISAHLDNPWMRVIVEGPNEMEQKPFNPRIHKLKQKN